MQRCPCRTHIHVRQSGPTETPHHTSGTCGVSADPCNPLSVFLYLLKTTFGALLGSDDQYYNALERKSQNAIKQPTPYPETHCFRAICTSRSAKIPFAKSSGYWLVPTNYLETGKSRNIGYHVVTQTKKKCSSFYVRCSIDFNAERTLTPCLPAF